jgi:flagellar hook-associated protein 2
MVDSLMASDRQPLDRLNSQKSDLQSRLDIYNTLGTRFSSLLTAARSLASSGSSNPLAGMTVAGGDPSVLEATADASAQTGLYTVEISKLATRQTLASKPFDGGAAAGIGGDGNGKGSTGGRTADVAFRIVVAGAPLEIRTTLPAGATMAEVIDRIASAINAAGGAVSASVLQVGNGQERLLLQAKDAGAAAAVTSIEDLDGDWMAELGLVPDGGKDGSFSSTVQAASDAILSVNGIEVRSASNRLDDVLPGLTLNLKATGTQILEVQRDQDASVKQIQDFIAEFNKTVDEVRNQTRAADSDGSNRGPLSGELIFTRLRTALRDTIDRAVSGAGSLSRISQLGITFDREGHLDMGDGQKLRDALASGPAGVQALFQGAGQRLADLLNAYSKAGGILAHQEESTRSRIRALDTRIDQTNQNLARRQDELTRQLAQLQSGIGILTDQQKYLSGILTSSDYLFS